jgi:hypothetical protein
MPLCCAYCGYSYTKYRIVAHGCSTAQIDTQQAFKVKYMIKCNSSTPTKVDPYLTLENRESIRTLKTVDLNVMTFVSI